MKERPILFKGAMVRAILDDRKTQTRRIVKNSLRFGEPVFNDKTKESVFDDFKGTEYASLAAFARHACPYGKPGDRLWVRETFAEEFDYEYRNEIPGCPQERWHIDWHFRADGEVNKSQLSGTLTEWKPSIHMPRSASRIDLEIVSVRVERLQDITEEDAKAEGVDGPESESAKAVGWCVGPKAAYRFLWNSINGVDAWDANPYVWVVEFKRVKP